MQTYDVVENDGTTKTTSKYTCESKDLQYTIIGDNIKGDFNFINTDIPNKLAEILSEVGAAAAITDAFYFENGGKESDINKAYEEIKADIEKINTGLSTLHSAFMTDIDNVNAELENNFGYWAFNKPNLAERIVETVPEADSGTN